MVGIGRKYMKRFEHPFSPIIDENSKVLLLGTFPSLDSFSNNFYYGHKKNQFWKILKDIFNVKLESIEDKKSFLTSYHIALWDVIKSCTRKNSSDANLKDIELNDIDFLLKKYPSIKAIGFTSQRAYKLFKKEFSLEVDLVVLPSPSPAYAKMRVEEKIKIYKEFFKKYKILR